MFVRIISGEAGGIRLRVPAGKGVRPTTDRVKESLFGVLGDLAGSTVVDLFAGCGGLGLEALSRGARQLVLVERERRHLTSLKQNLAATLKALGPDVAPSADVVCADARHAPRLLAHLAGTVDILLADPPYHPGGDDFGAAQLLACPQLAEWAGNALLVLEHETGTDLPWAPRSTWKLVRQRRYGTTTVSLARQVPGHAQQAH